MPPTDHPTTTSHPRLAEAGHGATAQGSRASRFGGRVLGLLALGWGAAWLVWRANRSIAGGPMWSSWPLFGVELGGWLGVLLLVIVLWSAGEPDDTATRDAAATGDTVDVEVVVRVGDDHGAWLRATLLALDHRLPVRVIAIGGERDASEIPAIAEIAAEHGASFVRPDDADDLAGFRAAAASKATAVLLLDAGDVPYPGALASLLHHFRPDVAIVQGASSCWVDDSAEHDAVHRHQRDFEHRVLNPALGRFGGAVFTGSGALVRVSALRSVHSGPTVGPVAASVITSVLLQDGWRIVAPAEPVVVGVHPELSLDAAERVQSRWASAARLTVLDRDGALGHNDLRWRHRLGLLAWSMRPLAGIRRVVLVAVVVATLLSGTLPGRFEVRSLLVLWLPWFVLSPLAIALLTNGTIRPGDRARQPFRTLGSAWRGAIQADGRHGAPKLVVAGAFGLRHSVAPTATVALISIVLALRGWSDRFTHTLHPLSSPSMAGVVLVTLWLLWAALDALRLLARRAQVRTTTRVVTSLPCRWNDRAGLVVDLTPVGAGLLTDDDAEIGTEVTLDLVLPTSSGCTSASIRGVVRHTRAERTGEHHLGIEFAATTSWVADALAEHCLVEPARARWHADVDDRHRSTAIGPATIGGHPLRTLDEPPAPRRLGLRAAALVAVAGAIASTAPHPVEAAGTDPRHTIGTIRVAPNATVEWTGTTVTVTCAVDPGHDSRFGTTDDITLAPSTEPVDDRGRFSVLTSGTACWASFDAGPSALFLAPSGELAAHLGPVVVDLRHGTIPRPTIVAARRDGAGAAAPPLGSTAAVPVGSGVAGARLDGRLIPRRVAPEPRADQLAGDRAGMPPVLTSGVVLLSVLIGASVLVGSMLPGRRRGQGPDDPGGGTNETWTPPPGASQSTSPDFAMR